MNPSIGGMLWFSFFWLALAAALIWVVAYLVKRDAATKASNPNVKILAQQSKKKKAQLKSKEKVRSN